MRCELERSNGAAYVMTRRKCVYCVCVCDIYITCHTCHWQSIAAGVNSIDKRKNNCRGSLGTLSLYMLISWQYQQLSLSKRERGRERRGDSGACCYLIGNSSALKLNPRQISGAHIHLTDQKS